MTSPLEQVFPNLREGEFEITSPRDTGYNCVAWAAGDVHRWWWPAERPFAYWPPGVSAVETVSSFVEAFSTLGYEQCETGTAEPGFEKVAVFASADGVPTHMARQLSDNSWTSKLGTLEDISHIDLHGVSGSDYGDVVAFLKRRK